MLANQIIIFFIYKNIKNKNAKNMFFMRLAVFSPHNYSS